MTKKKISCATAPSAIGTYSQAIQAGNYIYISGQIPLDYKDMSISASTFHDQVEVVLNNLANIAMTSGCTLDDCVKLTVYLKDLENFSIVNTVMEKFFKEPYPARAAVEVSRLPKDVSIEIDAILYKE
tara:strand:- start:1902 stop:2285 length:384 start_codon:yes stop_codon:yes gene_type:complete